MMNPLGMRILNGISLGHLSFMKCFQRGLKILNNLQKIEKEHGEMDDED